MTFCILSLLKTPFQNGVSSCKKELAPARANFFFLRVDIIEKGVKNENSGMASLEKCINSPLYQLFSVSEIF